MKVFLQLLFLFTLPINLFSQKFSLHLSPLAGFSFSNINEFVYYNDKKESQLEWKNYKPLIGINAVCSIQSIVLDFKVQSSIPQRMGIFSIH
ncbi:MAG: hypothetical protein HDR32_10275 [Treponema sp.]|nr:hypothetical protein [Treponema sp.]